MLLLKPVLKPRTYLIIVLVLVVGFFTAQTSMAQTITVVPAPSDLSKVVQIEFDETGQMISAPPSSITDNTILMVTVNRREATYRNRIVAAHNRYLTALINLNKPTIVSSLGLDSAENATAQKILVVIKSKLATQILTLLKDSTKVHILRKYADVEEERKKLPAIEQQGQADGLLFKLFKLINIPAIDSLIRTEYLFHIKSSNENGLLIKPKCDKTITFSTDANCCSLAYNTYFFKINDLGYGPVKFDFELLETNNLFKQLIWQVEKDHDITKYMKSLTTQSLDIPPTNTDSLKKIESLKIDFITKQIKSILNFSLINSKGNGDSNHDLILKGSLDHLNNWIRFKEKEKPKSSKLICSEKEDKNQKAIIDSIKCYEEALKKDPNIISSFIDINNSLAINNINTITNPLKDCRAVAWLLQFAWLTQGQYLTANPAKKPLDKQTQGLNKKLDSLKKDSIFLAKRLTKDENTAKAPGHKDFDALTTEYDSLLVKARNRQDSMAAVRDTLKKLKAGSGSAQNINLNDSLLYSGFFYVNHQKQRSDCWDWLLWPDKPYYAFIRNHNALEDYQLMGRDPVRQINEKQQMLRLVQNSKKPGNILLNETITAVSPLDQLAVETTLSPASSVKLPADSTLKFTNLNINPNIGEALTKTIESNGKNIQFLGTWDNAVHVENDWLTPVFNKYINGIDSLTKALKEAGFDIKMIEKNTEILSDTNKESLTIPFDIYKYNIQLNKNETKLLKIIIGTYDRRINALTDELKKFGYNLTKIEQTPIRGKSPNSIPEDNNGGLSITLKNNTYTIELNNNETKLLKTIIGANDGINALMCALENVGFNLKAIKQIKNINKTNPSKKIIDSADFSILYTLYKNAKKAANSVLAPYKNGILTLPVQPMRDTSANYYTNKLVNGSEIYPKNTVAYVIDSAVDKTLKKQKLAFSYTVDKLFRFRLKAGIAYSWLETRSYTITPATNTATYVNNYVDLGPTIGIQIFTSKLDVQSQRALPTGIYPFVYVGYLYSKAATGNFLLGAGWEVCSGIAVTGGVHFGASQELTVVQGNLETKGYFKGAPFVSVTIGIEALTNIFNATSSLGTAFKIP